VRHHGKQQQRERGRSWVDGCDEGFFRNLGEWDRWAREAQRAIPLACDGESSDKMGGGTVYFVSESV